MDGYGNATGGPWRILLCLGVWEGTGEDSEIALDRSTMVR